MVRDLDLFFLDGCELFELVGPLDDVVVLLDTLRESLETLIEERRLFVELCFQLHGLAVLSDQTDHDGRSRAYNSRDYRFP